MTIDELERRLTEWHFKRYGRHSIDAVRTALKINEEAGEIAKAVLKDDRENLAEEVADTLFCLIHMARYLGTNLLTLAAQKLPVIEKRLEKSK